MAIRDGKPTTLFTNHPPNLEAQSSLHAHPQEVEASGHLLSCLCDIVDHHPPSRDRNTCFIMDPAADIPDLRLKLQHWAISLARRERTVGDAEAAMEDVEKASLRVQEREEQVAVRERACAALEAQLQQQRQALEYGETALVDARGHLEMEKVELRLQRRKHQQQQGHQEQDEEALHDTPPKFRTAGQRTPRYADDQGQHQSRKQYDTDETVHLNAIELSNRVTILSQQMSFLQDYMARFRDIIAGAADYTSTSEECLSAAAFHPSPSSSSSSSCAKPWSPSKEGTHVSMQDELDNIGEDF